MKLHSSERPNPLEPQLPLQAGSTPEVSGKRSKRRSKSKKSPLIEKKFNALQQMVETEIHQDEVRLIWDRDATDVEEPIIKPQREKQIEIAKKVATSPAVEAVIDRAKIAETDQKLGQKKVVSKKQNESGTPTPQPAKATATPEKIESTPEAFDELLKALAAERKATPAEPENFNKKPSPDAPRAETHYSEPDTSPAFGAQEVPLGPSPMLPPEASSYRHFFWNEPSIISPAEAQAERSMLPSIGQTEAQHAPTSPDRTYVETHASVAPKRPKKSAEKQPDHFDQTAETESQPLSLEAIPLHSMGELQFPERMPGVPTPRQFEYASELVPQPTPETPATSNLQPQQDLGLAELIKLSKKIKVDGVKLHEMYAAKRIDEAGLRAVTQAFLRGGNVRKQLTDEIVNKEKSFERDPGTRHLTSDQVRDKLAGASVKVVQRSYQLGKTSKKVTREATQVLKSAAVMAHQELQNSGISVHWPSVSAIAIIYTLIIILLIV